jgi:hypothetical protein
MKLALVQPSLRREWHLVRDDRTEAMLWIQLFRRGGAAEIAGRRLAFEPQGGFRSAYVVRDQATGGQRARVLTQSRQRVLELGDRTAEWKRLGGGQGYGFVGADGELLLRAKVRSGIARTNGEIEIANDLPEPDALIAAVVGSFLLLRKAEEAASAAAGSVAATTSV